MLVTSSQSSTQRPLGLSVEELFALDRQFRRIEQQQQHIAQLQAQTRQTSSNLNRLASRSLDLVSSPSLSTFPVLPSLEIHGHSYSHRTALPPPTLPAVLNHPRSNSTDQLRYIPPPPPPPVLKYSYPQRSKVTDVGQQNYESKYRSYMQQSPMPVGNHFMSDPPSSSADYSDNRTCKLRRQHPIKRESSRRIVVRPVVHRRREPSISSSCESLDEVRPSMRHPPPPSVQVNIPNQSVPFTPASSFVEDAIDDSVAEETHKLNRSQSNSESLSDDDEVNLYEMRVSIGKTYDTADISVQLEGSKILIHCYTIEPTDKRGNYRKHEYKSELLVPDVVDDETIIAYLTEDGQLIVEGKYHLWAWKEIKKKRRFEQEQLKNSSSTKSRGGDLEEKRLTLNNNRWDGQYLFTNDKPSILIYYLRLPFQTLMDSIRIQSDSELNLLKIFIEQQERSDKLIIRSTSRLCRLPKDYQYDYDNLRVKFEKDNFIRIEIPTLNSFR